MNEENLTIECLLKRIEQLEKQIFIHSNNCANSRCYLYEQKSCSKEKAPELNCFIPLLPNTKRSQQ